MAMVRSWWIQSSLAHLEDAERRLLRYTKVKAYDTPVGDGLYIHTLEGGKSNSEKYPLVLCHGYGQGAAAFYMNLPHLTENMHVYAKDWMGYGISSRPVFNIRGVKETEDYFIKYMENWRAENKLSKMVLCGHSLGGYLCVAYAERHPERVEKLILVSPVGVPHKPKDFDDMIASRPWKTRQALGSLAWLWDRGVTPGDLVRCFGPIGKRLVEGYAQRRFRDGGELDKTTFGEYLYHNAAATKGSGEKALNELLLPYAWAKEPLCDRIPNLNHDIPIHFIYGTHDWMDHRYALDVQEKAADGRQKIIVELIPEAGHQVFLDCPNLFNEAILKAYGIENPKPPPVIELQVEVQVEVGSESGKKIIATSVARERINEVEILSR